MNGDFVGTAFFYNKDLFTQAGIEAAPTSWRKSWPRPKRSRMPASRHCRLSTTSAGSAGTSGRISTPPTTSCSTGCDGLPGSPRRTRRRASRPASSPPRIRGSWLVADVEGIHRPRVAGIRGPGTGRRRRRHPRRLRRRQDRHLLQRQLDSAEPETIGIEFELDAFSFPILTTEDIEFATDTDVSAVVGGPFAAYQYAMSTAESNKTMEEEGKSAAVLDFLRYIGTPEVDRGGGQRAWLASPRPLPAPRRCRAWKRSPSRPTRASGSSTSGTPAHRWTRTSRRAFGLYMSGNLDLDQATQADPERARPRGGRTTRRPIRTSISTPAWPGSDLHPGATDDREASIDRRLPVARSHDSRTRLPWQPTTC